MDGWKPATMKRQERQQGKDGQKREETTNLFGALVSMTLDSKTCLTGVAVEVVDV